MIELPSNKTPSPAEKQILENHTSTRENDDHHHSFHSTTPPQSISTKGILQKKLILLCPLLLCLYLLTDTTHHIPYNYNETTAAVEKQHLAFITALSRHPPALRVFRIVSESAFLLFCAAFALWVWELCDETTDVMLPTTTIASHEEKEERISLSSTAEQCTNNTQNDRISISIPSKSVGKLLFAPPPNSITDNVAWKVYQRHRSHRRLLLVRHNQKRRRRRRLSSGGDDGTECLHQDGMSNEEEHGLLELQPQQQNPEEVVGDLPSSLFEGHKNEQSYSPLDDRIRHEDGTNAIDHDENDKNDDQTHKLQVQTDETASSPTPPSSTSVLGATLDITTVMCMFLIFFTISSAEGGRYIDHKARGAININPSSSNHDIIDDNADTDTTNNEISYMKLFARIAAPLFPITLFLLSILSILIPWKKRKSLWTILSLTLGAPYYEVTFRDGFIGDILTSAVRPLQDLAYTLVFLVVGLQSWWITQSSNGYIDNTTFNTTTTTSLSTIEQEEVPLERSWLLHTLILPACTLSPLWWRFLQNLRQCFDTQHRWPYLGNAFKYMLAAEVAIFGMFDPSVKRHPVWIGCFLVATLYQVWWDVFMDWGLLEWIGDDVMYQYYHHGDDLNRSGSSRGFFWWWPYKLRTKRAYPHKSIYYTIFILNFCLRFVGMLTLIPPVYLSRRTGLIVNTWYDPDVQLFVGSMAASAEIFRRTIWALLRLEWEIIKTSPSMSSDSLKSDEMKKSEGKKKVDVLVAGKNDDSLDLFGDDTAMKPMAISSSTDRNRGGRFRFSLSNQRWSKVSLATLSDMSNLNSIQILSELCAWATVFSGIAIIAAAHREIL